MNTGNKLVQADILRYKKNKLAANLALLGLVFNCLYFMLLYGIKASTDTNGKTTWFASLMMGFSVVLTLIFLLVCFLSSEGVKGYNKKFAYVLFGLAAWQILRIFGYPLYGLKNNLLTVNYFWLNPTKSGTEFAIMLVYLIASACCLVAAGVIGLLRALNLEKHEKAIANGELDMDAELKALEREDEAKAQATANLINANPAVDGVIGTVHSEISGDEAVILPEPAGEKPAELTKPIGNDAVILPEPVGSEEVQ